MELYRTDLLSTSLNVRLRRAALVLGIAIAVSATPARSQSILLPEIVNYAGQTPLESSRVGASVTVVSGEKLREQGVPTVSEALRFVPGLAVTQSGNRGGLTTVSIRGADARNLMVLIDGIEVNQLGFPGYDFADLPTDDVERIEIIRGPQSGIYGANANSGVIAITTLSGKGLARPAASTKFEAGTRDTVAASVNARGAAGPAYGSITVSDYTTRGYNVSRFGSEPDGSRAAAVHGKAGIDLGPLNIEGVFRHTDRSVQTDPQDFNFGSPTFGFIVDGDAVTKYRSTDGRLGATLTLFDGRWIQSANAKVHDERTRAWQDGFFSFGADGTRTTFDYKSTFLGDTNVIGGERHSFTLFTENRREEYQQVSDVTRYIKERTGLAGEYVLDLPTNTTLSGALRQDWNSAFADATTWRLALSQRFPTTGTRIHASYGKGVTDPDVFQLFGSPFFNLPNPGLTPEQSIGWDVGVEQSFLERRVLVDVTYFSTEFTNKIELTFDATRGGFVYVNGPGVSPRQGVEVAATFNMLDWLSLAATYTYTDARDTFGQPEVRRPPHSGSLEATARFFDNRAKATVGVTFNGTRKDFFFGAAGTTLADLPGATVVRAMLSYDVTPWSTVYLRAENLFDARYEEVFSYRAPPLVALAGLRVKLN